MICFCWRQITVLDVCVEKQSNKWKLGRLRFSFFLIPCKESCCPPGIQSSLPAESGLTWSVPAEVRLHFGCAWRIRWIKENIDASDFHSDTTSRGLLSSWYALLFSSWMDGVWHDLYSASWPPKPKEKLNLNGILGFRSHYCAQWREVRLSTWVV